VFKELENYMKRAPLVLNHDTDEGLHQKELMRKHKALNDKYFEETGQRKKMHIATFGCQMNFHDSEKLKGVLEEMGYEEIDTEDGADFVVYNTCAIRENAEQRVYGRIGHLKSLKRKNPNMLIALCGCMMQQDTVIQKLKESYKHVDIVFGTHNIYKLAELIDTRLETKEQIFDIWESYKDIVEDLPMVRKHDFKAAVNIIFGCNNFCTYCIVPYVRGRERSREVKDIIEEIKVLVADGVKEIMLLGQNVNSYGKNLEHPVSFAGLLEEIEQIEGLERIRFMTSHPKDLSDELIQVMAKSTKICKSLHLPIQSGSTAILNKMNRRYTKESYMALVKKIKTAMPDIALTTDIIVGFPGETEEDFVDTLDVIKEVEYDSAYTFIYSKRTGTPAAMIEEQVPEDVSKERFDRLLAEVNRIAEKKSKAHIGLIADVLVEEPNKREGLVTGRLDDGHLVHFKGDTSLIGSMVKVKIVDAKSFYLMGEPV
jgi:tRNA-2-methylthio-N6-dimethylallyladenosine synthase